MIKIQGAGAVAFIEENGERRYLLVKYGEEDGGHWSCPKGIREEGEDLLECAEREFTEETGINETEVIPGFKHKTNYRYDWDGTVYDKTVFYYLFRIKTKEVTLSPENEEYAFVDTKELNKETYKYAYEIIEKAEQFLKSKR